MSSTSQLGIICSAEEYAGQRLIIPLHCLTRGQSIGLTIVAESGFVSLFAVLFVFGIIFRNALHHVRKKALKDWDFLQEPMDVFMLSLFFADFIQALGAVLDIKWINEGKVETGPFCTAQGIIQQLGETGVAITTLIIALYTFIVVRWRKGMDAIIISKLVIVIAWAFTVILIIVGNTTRGPNYEEPTPVRSLSPSPQFLNPHSAWFGEYVWFWITLGVQPDKPESLEEKARRRNSLSMIASVFMISPCTSGLSSLRYPAVYSILVLPLSVVRWITFNGKNQLGSEATLIVISIYGLSGMMNVILLLVTRPNSVLFGKTGRAGRGRVSSPRGWSDPQVHAKEDGTEDSSQFGLDDESVQMGRLPSIDVESVSSHRH
ncbi:hypothetical protein IW261DRAFT_1566827 [Armillaria novae-zelandiae]|uniref:Glucose receptor Git3 N-terminal domain-containing protein n=1 Tax=Armillaria novae-zelandiae TaxID=153914 RepID=A0AA39P3R5_9AGAR|nr:hypothetical protein IW261DRAFT_1566827 [Armillaria novae-zelandiae]